MILVYVAGPFRAANSWEMEQNIRRAETVALDIWRAGFACICPHTNTRFYQGAAPDDVWLKGDLEMIKRCDAVFMMYGWERSEGARAERELALKLKLDVFYSLVELRRSCEADPLPA